MLCRFCQVAPRLVLVFAVVAAVFGGAGTAAAAPPAPTGLSPANGASVTVPFTISWNAVTDPNGIAAYNWEVSNSSSMSPVIRLNSTNGTTTTDTISGLANGTYFWHVQAVNGAFFQSAWSATQSFTVTGANAGEPGAPTLNPPQGATQFHPMETIQWTWSAVPGAATYIFDASNDPNFPVATKVHFDNVPTNSFTLDLGDSEPQGTWYVRVQAVNSARAASQPSNVQTFVLSFNAPLPPPPTPLSPVNGATAPLPITFKWTDVPNPQPLGYTIEVATDPGFANIAFLNNQITGPQYTVTSLPAGTLYWRVNSTQGDSAPNTAAVTAWSQTATFVVPAAPMMASLQVTIDPASAGDGETLNFQFTGPAPSGGTVVNLTSSNQTAAPLPATFTMPAGFASGQLLFTVGQVTASTPVTLTGKLSSGSTASVTFTVQPPSLQSLSMNSPMTGGVPTGGIVQLHGNAPAGGLNVSLSSSSTSVQPPATVTVPAGSPSVSFNIPTLAVTTATSATVTATYNGKSVSTPLTLNPQVAPASISLSPTSVTGSTSSFATVSLASTVNYDVQLPITSSNPSVASVNKFVTVPCCSGANGGFNIFVTPVTTTTNVTISVTGAGVTKSAVLTVQPAGSPPPTGPTLSNLTLNPSTIPATSTSQGTVTFSSAVSAATTVSLSSGNTAASVPASVTVPAGGTSATFTVTAGLVSGTTTFNIVATYNGNSLFAPLTVTQAPPGPAGVTGVTIAPSSIVGGANSTGTVNLGQAAPNGGTAVTLSSSNTAAATVPASVTVPAGATSANFAVTTKVVTSPQSVTITAAGGGTSATASMTVTPSNTGGTGGTTIDTVKISQAEYVVSDKVLNIQATSTSSNATLKAYVTLSNTLIGTLQNKGGGQYQGQLNWSTNPQNVTVKSSLGGSASSPVTAK
jgi:hypothetical protein